jgi:Cu2+-exporting ATPase
MQCFHCHLPVPANTHWVVSIDNQSQPMCCPGCQAVAQMIVDNNLDSYYQLRDKPAVSQQDIIPSELQALTAFDDAEIQKDFVFIEEENAQQCMQHISLLVEGITCAACVWLIEQQLKKLPGVVQASVNLSNHIAYIRWDGKRLPLSQILRKIQQIGYNASPYQANAQQRQLKQAQRQALKRIAVAGLGMMQVMTFAVALYFGAFQGIDYLYQTFFRWVSLLVTTPIYFYAGAPFLQGAWRSIKNQQFGMDIPVALAISIAYFASFYATLSHTGEVYFDAVCMFVFFLSIGRYLEMRARARCSETLFNLQQLTPHTATLYNQQQEKVVLVKQLNIGDLLLVKPGETIPVDGEITQGESSIDEALLSGESLPTTKHVGDKVIAGSQNIDGPLVVKVTQMGKQTVLSAIIQLLERAQAEKPITTQWANKVASYFVAITLLFASMITLLWLQIDPSKAFWVMLSVLVITCPCALSLAIPTALTASINFLAKQGFLISQGHVLETLLQVQHIVFDKTGTLTTGKFKIVNILPSAGYDQRQVVKIAASVEKFSNHPISHAFLHYCQQHNIQSAEDVTQVVNHPTLGIEGQLNGQCFYVGSSEYVSKLLATPLSPPQQTGIWVALCDKQQLLAWFQLEDSLREDALKTVAQLQAQGKTLHMLTGDSSSAVPMLAQQLHISHFKANAKPSDKVHYIQQLQKTTHQVMMVGDGINDAPVLSTAQLSVAMGSGTDLAKMHADVILLHNHLPLLNLAFAQAKKNRQIVRQNIFWVICYNSLALPLAALGYVTPYIAALGMSLSSLVVVLNALRLVRN